jgi:hypothetical protein
MHGDQPLDLAAFGDLDEPTLREAVDRAQIEHIVLHWAHEVDGLRPDRAVAFFTEDCVVDYGPRAPMGVLRSRAAYVAMMAEAQSTAPVTPQSSITARADHCSHHITQVLVSFPSTDTATSRARCFSLVVDPAGQRQVTFGAFEDTYRRTASGWRVTARTQRPLGHANWPTPGGAGR